MATLHLSYEWRRFIAHAVYQLLDKGGLSTQVETWASDLLIDLYTAEPIGQSMPIGSIFAWPGSVLPDNTLPCDGQSAYLRHDYPDLYDALDPVFRIDEIAFRTPDLRDRSIIGEGSSYIVGDTGGEAEHILTVNEMPSHSHDLEMGTDSATSTRPDRGTAAISYTTDVAITKTGGDEPHNNMPPYMALHWVIVALAD